MLLSNMLATLSILPILITLVGGGALKKKEVTQVEFKADKEDRRVSDEGILMIKEFEGVKHNIYYDTTGHLTGGVGHLLTLRDRNIYHHNSPISERQVDEWLRSDLKKAEKCVNDWTVPELTQSGFDALVSLVFNIGCDNFKRSTLLKRLNKGLVKETSDEFTRWVYSRGRKLAGLVSRRQKEAQLFRDAETTDEIAAITLS